MSQSARLAALVGSVAIVGGLVAGCTDTSAGQPLPTNGAPNTDTAASTPRSSETPGSTPARPREIRLDGKNPCSLLPQSDWPKFHIEKPGEQRQEPTFKSPDCFYSNNVGAFNVTLVVTEGIEKWTDGSRSGVAEEVVPIDDFPAISITRKGNQNQCGVAVDVADGQYLLAGVLIHGPSLSKVPERCEYAHQLAESAMSTLVGS